MIKFCYRRACFAVLWITGASLFLSCPTDEQVTGLKSFASFEYPEATGMWVFAEGEITGDNGEPQRILYQAAPFDSEQLVNYSSALLYCDDLKITYKDKIFDGWRMPTKDEMAMIYANLKAQGLAKFSSTDTLYWTQSSSTNGIYCLDFAKGTYSTVDKAKFCRIRAIRTIIPGESSSE